MKAPLYGQDRLPRMRRFAPPPRSPLRAGRRTHDRRPGPDARRRADRLLRRPASSTTTTQRPLPASSSRSATACSTFADVGLGYLTLDRLSSTLSGGESQRINLSTSLGSNLTGSLYILDEPSIGLHPRDTNRLIGVLKQLRDLGNTVIVVEHEEEVIRAADWIVDIGPKAGYNGGEVVFNGTLDGLLKCDRSLTADYPHRTPRNRPSRRASAAGAARSGSAGAREKQPPQHRRPDPARRDDLHHRRQRLGKIIPRQGNPLSRTVGGCSTIRG